MSSKIIFCIFGCEIYSILFLSRKLCEARLRLFVLVEILETFSDHAENRRHSLKTLFRSFLVKDKAVQTELQCRTQDAASQAMSGQENGLENLLEQMSPRMFRLKEPNSPSTLASTEKASFRRPSLTFHNGRKVSLASTTRRDSNDNYDIAAKRQQLKRSFRKTSSMKNEEFCKMQEKQVFPSTNNVLNSPRPLTRLPGQADMAANGSGHLVNGFSSGTGSRETFYALSDVRNRSTLHGFIKNFFEKSGIFSDEPTLGETEVAEQGRRERNSSKLQLALL